MTGARGAQLAVHLAGTDAPPTMQGPGAARRHGRQAVRLIADGTGRSEGEVPWLLAMAAASAVLAGAAAATYGVLRLFGILPPRRPRTTG